FGMSRMQSAIEASGGNVTDALSIADIPEWLVKNCLVDTLVMEICEDSGATLDRALDHINQAVLRDSMALILTIPHQLIDPIAARINAPWATILCDPTPTERIAALSLAWAEQNMRLNDRGTDSDAVRLRDLALEVGRIANALASVNDGRDLEGSHPAVHDVQLHYQVSPQYRTEFELKPAHIRALIKERRQRERHCDLELFADPAWDMMLDLMASRLENVRVSVSSLCIAAAVPPTTALRWIKTLTDLGHFVRIADPTDGRRVFIELSDMAASKLSLYFQDIHRN
ncbi:MAG: hypothetical protein KGQ42_01030, partial [Alphaproteobacteria bacterium]|nr:hypothetical protein [Alphaproteobacteria bacterium]